jgi:hypothetical protein
MKRQLTPAAQVAKLIRQQLKTNGIPARVTSENYSMGNSVRVALLNDPLPATVDAVKRETAKYQAGHFDGMQDLYEYSNRRDDIPQTKFLFVEAEYTAEIRQDVWDWLRERFAGFEGAPASYRNAGSYALPGGIGYIYGYEAIHQALHDVTPYNGFWATRKPRQRAA